MHNKYVNIPSNISCDFCTVASDNSMAMAGIRQGDLVMCCFKNTEDVKDGDIVVIGIEAKILLRKLFFTGKHQIALHTFPIHGKYTKPTLIDTDTRSIQIFGKVVGVYRSLNSEDKLCEEQKS